MRSVIARVERTSFSRIFNAPLLLILKAYLQEKQDMYGWTFAILLSIIGRPVIIGIGVCELPASVGCPVKYSYCDIRVKYDPFIMPLFSLSHGLTSRILKVTAGLFCLDSSDQKPIRPLHYQGAI